MEPTIQSLKSLIKQIDSKISKLKDTIISQEEEIAKLKTSYQDLQVKHQKTLSQIKDYIKKIDNIKNNNNVDINNNN
jgi:predicted  nucleic acid-binding Zn-ribbon protein